MAFAFECLYPCAWGRQWAVISVAEVCLKVLSGVGGALRVPKGILQCSLSHRIGRKQQYPQF